MHLLLMVLLLSLISLKYLQAYLSRLSLYLKVTCKITIDEYGDDISRTRNLSVENI